MVAIFYDRPVRIQQPVHVLGEVSVADTWTLQGECSLQAVHAVLIMQTAVQIIYLPSLCM